MFRRRCFGRKTEPKFWNLTETKFGIAKTVAAETFGCGESPGNATTRSFLGATKKAQTSKSRSTKISPEVVLNNHQNVKGHRKHWLWLGFLVFFLGTYTTSPFNVRPFFKAPFSRLVLIPPTVLTVAWLSSFFLRLLGLLHCRPFYVRPLFKAPFSRLVLIPATANYIRWSATNSRS